MRWRSRPARRCSLCCFSRSTAAAGVSACTLYSEKHDFALELRISLLIMFALAALAVSTHVSIMLAGFALGLLIGAVGEPRRLARQLFGITEGFFSPLFFGWLGASLQVRELGAHPKLILLGVILGLGLTRALRGTTARPAAHTRRVIGRAARSAGAAATIGTEEHLLVAGEASAMMLGALLTIAATSIAGAVAARGQPEAKGR